MAERMLFAEEVAELIGVAAASIKTYQYTASRARREGQSGPELFPEPAARVRRVIPREGRHAVAAMVNQWRASDIAAWVEHRPQATGWPEERRAEVAARLRALVA